MEEEDKAASSMSKFGEFDENKTEEGENKTDEYANKTEEDYVVVVNDDYGEQKEEEDAHVLPYVADRGYAPAPKFSDFAKTAPPKTQNPQSNTKPAPRTTKRGLDDEEDDDGYFYRKSSYNSDIGGEEEKSEVSHDEGSGHGHGHEHGIRRTIEYVKEEIKEVVHEVREFCDRKFGGKDD